MAEWHCYHLWVSFLQEKKISRSFPSYPKPLLCEAKCEAIDMKLIFYSHANKTHFLKRGFLIGLVLKVSVWNSEIAYYVFALE